MNQQADDKILVVGHLGMLGSALMRRWAGRAVGVDRAQCDITCADAIEAALEAVRPAAIVNCAAYTAVDRAESEPEAAFRLNGEAAGLLARAAARRAIHFLTIGTDYVFTGAGSDPWPEDPPDAAFGPASVYGASKLEGERLTRAAGGRWGIVRTQWLYGAGGGNFIETIAALAAEREAIDVVDDQIGAPTWTEDLAWGLERLLEQGATGCYHVVNAGYASWHTVACRVVERLGLACQVRPVASAAFPRPAPRPHNSRLAQDRFAALAGRPMRPWTEALDAYLAGRG